MSVKKYLSASTLAVVIFGGAFLFGRSPNPVALQNKKPDLTEAKYFGASSCGKCHADYVDGKPGKWNTDFVLMSEFATWRNKDRHALAYVVLEGPRGQQMSKLLNIDVTKEPQCLNCHSTTSRQERQGKEFNPRDGVSCDGCHGPAQHWLLEHAFEPTWRAKTPEEKEELGMYDVRNPTKRTQLCVSCHVGSAAEGKVVTHAMYAAGHPPLPSFEAAGFSKNLPPHWRDLKDVKYFKEADAKIKKQNYFDDADFQHTKLVLATCGESLRAMMELVGSRAALDATPKERNHAWPPAWLRPFAKNTPVDRWPELPPNAKELKGDELQTLWPEIAMAQADCYACHHDLKSKSWRQLRGYGGRRPGRPQLQPWPFALMAVGLENQSAEDKKIFAAKIAKVGAAFDTKPFGTPGDIAAAAQELENLTATMLKPTATVDRAVAQKVLTILLAKGSSELLDYDTPRQIAWATRAVFSEWKGKGAEDKAVTEIFAKLDNELNLSLQSEARQKFVAERYELTKNLANSDTEFAAKVKDAKFLAALQKISDQELASSLARINDYDPAQFKSRMEELSELIFGKAAKKVNVR